MVHQFGYFEDKQAQIEEFKRRALRAHNRYRSWHGAGPLTINETLNRLAQGVAENLKYIDHLVHSNTKLPNGEPLGENLASSTGPLSGRFCTDLWYDEERMHDYSGEYTKPTGHFTQLVWKATTQVGFGVATRGKYTVGVALYYQAGNVIGSFKQNVQPPMRRSTFPPTSNPTFHSAPSLQHSHSTLQLPQSQPTFSSSRRRAESLNNLPYGSLSKKNSQSHDNLFDNGYQNNVLSAAGGNISGLAHSSSNSLFGSNPNLHHSGSFSFGSSGFLGSAHNLYGSGYFHHPIYPSVINPFISGALGFAF